MKTLYFDIFSGISGDMALSALISLGVDEKEISEILSKLTNIKIDLSVEKIDRHSISANLLKIKTTDDNKRYRNLNDIKNILENSNLKKTVIENSIKTFEILAIAEAEVHNMPVEKVHFHEIGAIDSIIDIVGVSYALDTLSINKIQSSKPVFGYGTVKTEHGILPLPAPATIRILNGIDVKRIDVEGELTTPTGAAILKANVHEFKNSFNGTIIKEVYSTGNMSFIEIPNLLRTILLEDNNDKIYTDKIYQISTNIDDMTGEALGFLLDNLLSVGAYDVAYTQATGKKNRPTHIMNIILPFNLKDIIIETVFKFSTTAGIRISEVDRVIMDREFRNIDLFGNNIKVKILKYHDIEKASPEWDDCAAVSKIIDMTPIEVYYKAMSIINNQ